MKQTTPRTVLLVDDSADDRAVIRRLLRRQRPEYTVLEASSGEAGLERIRQARPDCVLLDYHLPDMDGGEFLDRLRHGSPVGRSTPVPVALLTGQDSDEVGVRVLDGGAQDYLVKDGITAPALARAVENAIEKWAIQTTLEKRNHELDTLRVRLEATIRELAEATRVKDQFMAVMSHEMRTPLNAILGYVELLEMGVGGELSTGQRAYVERIHTGGSNLLELINDVLDLARADAQRLDLDLHTVDVTAVAEEVVALLEARAERAGIELRLEPCPAPVFARADLRRLRQILTNLVGNALKFTEEGTVVVRCAAQPDGRVRIQVLDSGIGIEPALLPLIFQDFYQVDGNLTRLRGGSGLGLAISQRLAQAMDGEIVAESELGRGSTFTLYLSAAPADLSPRAEDELAHAARMRQHRDEQEQRRAAAAPVAVVAFSDRTDVLGALAERVQPAVRLLYTTDERAVAELAVRETARLVVLDIGCGGGVGWVAAHAVRERPPLAETPILLLPAIPDAARAESPGALNLGWVTLVPKPFTATQLTAAVETVARDKGGADAPAHRILVLDDDADSRRIAREVLEDAGAEVAEVADGESALALMRREAPDVLVLDLMMPVLDGFGVLAAMRTDPLLARIPVVVLTAKTLTDSEREFLARSATRVLRKGEHRLSDVATLVLRAAGASLPRP